MSPRKRIVNAARILPLIGLVLFLPPYIRIFDQPAFIAGIPLLHFAIFGFWLAGIVLTGIVARRLAGHTSDEDQD